MSHSWRKTDVNRGMWSAGGGAGEGQRADVDRRGGGDRDEGGDDRRTWSRRVDGRDRTRRTHRGGGSGGTRIAWPRRRDRRRGGRRRASPRASPCRSPCPPSPPWSRTTTAGHPRSGANRPHPRRRWRRGRRPPPQRPRRARGRGARRARETRSSGSRDASRGAPSVARERSSAQTDTRRGMLGGDFFTEVGRARLFVETAMRARRAEF